MRRLIKKQIKKKDGGFPSFNYGIKGYWEFMRGYMVNNHFLYYDKKEDMSIRKWKKKLKKEILGELEGIIVEN